MFLMSSKTYDFFKKLVQVIIPAVSSAYFALAEIWDLPGAEKVTGTLAVLATLIGIVVGISSNTYNKLDQAFDGTVEVTTTEEGKKLFSLEVNGNPLEIENMGSVRFKVNKQIAEG